MKTTCEAGEKMAKSSIRIDDRARVRAVAAARNEILSRRVMCV